MQSGTGMSSPKPGAVLPRAPGNCNNALGRNFRLDRKRREHGSTLRNEAVALVAGEEMGARSAIWAARKRREKCAAAGIPERIREAKATGLGSS